MKIDNFLVDSQIAKTSPVEKISLKTGLKFTSLQKREELYLKDRQDLGKDTLYLTSLKGQVFMKCPCSKGSINCGYYVLDTMVGCPYCCSYCYLQIYQNVKAISCYANLEEKIKPVAKALKTRKKKIRVGTGEFCDSLTLEDLYPQVDILYFYFKQLNNIWLELKTKSDNINRILKLKPAQNFVISWSLNPVSIAAKEEKGAPSVDARIKAVKTIVQKGWNTGFHFDPLLYYPGWQEEYLNVIRKLKKINPAKVKWISLGSLRFPPQLKNIILYSNDSSDILNYGEFVLSDEGKVRYYRKIRVEMYRFMFKELKKLFKETPIYLCMETPVVWQEVFGFIPGPEYFYKLFI